MDAVVISTGFSPSSSTRSEKWRVDILRPKFCLLAATLGRSMSTEGSSGSCHDWIVLEVAVDAGTGGGATGIIENLINALLLRLCTILPISCGSLMVCSMAFTMRSALLSSDPLALPWIRMRTSCRLPSHFTMFLSLEERSCSVMRAPMVRDFSVFLSLTFSLADLDCSASSDSISAAVTSLQSIATS